MLARPSRRMWIAALVVSALCVGGLAYALVTEWNTPAERQLEPTQRQATHSSGFGFGLLVGIGAGIAIGSLLGLRRKPPEPEPEPEAETD